METQILEIVSLCSRILTKALLNLVPGLLHKLQPSAWTSVEPVLVEEPLQQSWTWQILIIFIYHFSTPKVKQVNFLNQLSFNITWVGWAAAPSSATFWKNIINIIFHSLLKFKIQKRESCTSLTFHLQAAPRLGWTFSCPLTNRCQNILCWREA